MPLALNGSFQFTGEIAALTAALFWAVSSILFKKLGKTIPPIEMNLLKGTLAIVLFFVTSLVLKEKTASLSLQAVLMLAISGALGIGYGDTVYFEALNILGARRTLLITILAPVFTAILAWIFLHENLALIGWLGIVVTMAGIAWVITEQKNGDAENKKLLWRGVFYGFLAALTQAIGAVISRWALTETTVSALQSAMIRLIAGVVFLLVWIVVKRVKIGQWVQTFQQRQPVGNRAGGGHHRHLPCHLAAADRFPIHARGNCPNPAGDCPVVRSPHFCSSKREIKHSRHRGCAAGRFRDRDIIPGRLIQIIGYVQVYFKRFERHQRLSTYSKIPPKITITPAIM